MMVFTTSLNVGTMLGHDPLVTSIAATGLAKGFPSDLFEPASAQQGGRSGNHEKRTEKNFEVPKTSKTRRKLRLLAQAVLRLVEFFVGIWCLFH